MSAVESSIEVEVSLEEFFKVVSDFESYPQFLSEVRGVKVLGRGKDALDVEYTIEVDAGIARKQLKYSLHHTQQPPGSLKWKLIKGEMMKTNQGEWRQVALGPKRTRATYVIDISFGMLVPKSVANFLTERNLPAMLGEFKRRAEGLARK